MAKLTLRTPWTRQPQVPVGIDRSNPLTADLSVISVPFGGVVRNVFAGKGGDVIATASGSSASVAPMQSGLATKIAANTTDVWRLNSVANATTTAFESPSSAVTVLAFIQRFGNNANGNAPIFINASTTTNPFTAWGLVDASGSDNFRFEIATSGSIRQLTTGIGFGTAPVVIVGTYNGATQTAYMGGKVVGTPASVTGSLSYPSAADRGPAIGNFWNFTTNGRSFNGAVFLTALWNRALSASEVKQVSDNPWQLFRPLSRTIWVPAAAGGGTVYTMSPGGTITFSGNSNQLRTRTQVPSGSIVFSGTAPNLRTRLQTTSGSIVFSGTAPFSNSATYTMSPGGTITFSGTSIQNHERVQISTGNITFSGASTMLRTRSLIPTGDIIFSGTAPETRIRVQVPTGQIVFLGSAPLINPNAVGGVTTWRTLTGSGN